MKLTRALAVSLLLIGWLALTGCIESEVTRLGPAYPPTTRVDVLEQPPNVPYQPIARVEAVGDLPRAELVNALVQKAQNVGADAIILQPAEHREGSWGMGGSVLEATAIKYQPPR